MPIVVDPHARFAQTVDVLIVGAGGAGAIAALAARESNAEVVVLERDASPSGATARSSGMIPAAGTELQKARGIDDTPHQHAMDIQDKANGTANEALLHAYTEQSPAVLRWLTQRHGLRFELVDGLPPGHSAARMHALQDRGGGTLISALYSALAASRVRLQPGAKVTDLVVDDTQKILGVRFRRANGSDGQIGCKVLVVASNGFAANSEMLERYLPDMRALPFAGHEGSQGDALSWGEGLGAAIADIDGFIAHSAVVMSQRLALPWTLMTEGAIQVNREGERFVNEHEGYSESALFVLAQTDGVAFNIYDERVHEVGLTMPNYATAVESGVVKRAGTVRELAEQLGIARDKLEETIALVNALAFENDVDELGRRFDGTHLLLAPYYGVAVSSALLGTEGGLSVTAEGRVLRNDGSPFPNLFAAGGAARGVSGGASGGYLEGNGLLTAIVGGYLAGLHAGRLAA